MADLYLLHFRANSMFLSVVKVTERGIIGYYLMLNQKRCGWKQSWPYLKYYPRSLFEEKAQNILFRFGGFWAIV
jgi:hypothetical protein